MDHSQLLMLIALAKELPWCKQKSLHMILHAKTVNICQIML